MPKYIMLDGSTFEVLSIERAKTEIAERGGEDKETFLDRFKENILMWWMRVLNTI